MFRPSSMGPSSGLVWLLKRKFNNPVGGAVIVGRLWPFKRDLVIGRKGRGCIHKRLELIANLKLSSCSGVGCVAMLWSSRG